MNKRDFEVTKKAGEWWNAKVIDSYGNEYQNYFETAEEVRKWIYYIWENEKWFNSVDKEELLADAIHNCVELDKKLNLRPIL
tara:strand:+ start:1712 stop:1957 length:246 start_codon:yes stop_codon:yes gene_type:complete